MNSSSVERVGVHKCFSSASNAPQNSSRKFTDIVPHQMPAFMLGFGQVSVPQDDVGLHLLDLFASRLYVAIGREPPLTIKPTKVKWIERFPSLLCHAYDKHFLGEYNLLLARSKTANSPMLLLARFGVIRSHFCKPLAEPRQYVFFCKFTRDQICGFTLTRKDRMSETFTYGMEPTRTSLLGLPWPPLTLSRPVFINFSRVIS